MKIRAKIVKKTNQQTKPKRKDGEFMADRGREWRGPDFSITSFEVTEPVKQNGGWEVIVVVAVAYRRRGVPQQPQTVLVEVDGMTEAEEMTDPEGRVAVSLTLKEPGSYLVAAQIKGMPASKLCRRIPVKEEKPKPRKFSPPVVRAEGDNGKYVISVSVVYEDGEAAKGVPVKFLVSKSGLPGEVSDGKTDEFGFVRHDLAFGERECDVTVQIPGFEEKIENLYGPPRFKKTRVPEPDAGELGESPWRTLMRGWRKASEDLRKEAT